MQFTNGKYLAAKDKANILKAFERYIVSGFRRAKFTRALYQHLSLHFGFIAHYNIDGFHTERFADPVGRLATLDMIINASQWNFIDENTSGAADLNRAIRDTVVRHGEFIRKSAIADRQSYLVETIEKLTDELEALSATA